MLEGPKDEVGPVMKLQSLWEKLPVPSANQPDIARKGCEAMRDYVVQLRRKVEMRFLSITAGKVTANREPLLIWKNTQYATHRMNFDRDQLQVTGEIRNIMSNEDEPDSTNSLGPGHTQLVENVEGDPDLVVPAGQRPRYEAAFAKFCSVFPDMFYKQERGRNYFDTSKDQGRFLSAGFHNLMGYFRDDLPLYKLMLDDNQQKELDEMWRELDFVASANIRMYIQFTHAGGRGERPAIDDGEVQPVVVAEDREVTSEVKIKQLEAELHEAGGGQRCVGDAGGSRLFRGDQRAHPVG